MSATRREVIAGAALLVAPAAASAALTDDDRKKRGQAALVTALEFEQTAVVAYEAIANSGKLSVRATSLLRMLQDHDNQHAEQLAMALDSQGTKPPIPPRRAAIRGLARVHDDMSAATFAIDLELRAVGAYNQVVRYLGDPNLLRTVAGAMGTDGQHLVGLRQLVRREPVPGAFERGLTR
jgi:ferritin-like protein